MATLSYRYLATGGGVWMEVVISFLVTVMAGVACHLVCKWLDSKDKDNK
ncbi:MAG: nitrate reductase [Lachnospiraceae bacterium]|nr:nitrate reductase [Lachnospiraceae bacterium]